MYAEGQLKADRNLNGSTSHRGDTGLRSPRLPRTPDLV
jgi:hypothetical protein